MLSLYGGEYGIRDEGTLEMLINTPFQTMFGNELYPSVFDKAAKLLEGFARHQVFIDGNKRTGLATASNFLEINNIELTYVNDEAYNLSMYIANHSEVPVNKISQELQRNSRKIKFLNSENIKTYNEVTYERE